MRPDADLRRAQENRRRLRAAIDGIEALFPLPGFSPESHRFDPSPGDPLHAFKLDLVAQAVEAVEQATMRLIGKPAPMPVRFRADAFDAARRARIAEALASDTERSDYLRLCDAVADAASALRSIGAMGEGGVAVPTVSDFSDLTPRALPMGSSNGPA